MTHAELEKIDHAAYGQLGFSGELEQDIGENSSFPHGSTVPQVIREGSSSCWMMVATVEGYQSDITRTFVFGKPSDKMKKVFEIVHSCSDCRAEDGPTRRGMSGGGCGGAEGDSDAGYGPDYKFFTHRLGHESNGRHEWPTCARRHSST